MIFARISLTDVLVVFVVGRSVEETLRLIKAFEHTDKHGEVCPANWQPGEKTIIPNQDDKIKYF